MSGRQLWLCLFYKNKGSKLSASNYRPISLLSTISKLCERVAFGHLYQHVNPVLDPSQSGFRRGDSTAWQLLRLVQKLYECKDQKQFSLLCFFDLSKAFDTVWTRGLLHKLAAFGVAGTCLQWLTSYLTERRQSVRIGHALSAPLTVHSGVPQGSILGLYCSSYTLMIWQVWIIPHSTRTIQRSI